MDPARPFGEVVDSLNPTMVNTNSTYICPVSTVHDVAAAGLEDAFQTAMGFPSIIPNKMHHLLRMALD